MKTNFKRLLSFVLVMLMFSAVCFAGQSPLIKTTSEAASTNLALGKSVSFGYGASLNDGEDWGVSAVNSGIKAATDGVNNSPNYWANNGYYAALSPNYIRGPYSFTVNLGALSNVNNISAYFLERHSATVPSKVDYYVSTNGSSWTQVGTIESVKASYTTNSDSDGTYRIHKFSLDFDATEAMYVKISFPQNSGTYIFLGEIEAYGEKAPTVISTGITADCISFGYGSSVNDDANWGVTQIKKNITALTNGVSNSQNYYANEGTYVALRSAYVTGPYSFSMYLGDTQATVKTLSTYYLERYSAKVPDAVNYYVSADGVNWKTIGTVTATQASYTTGTASDGTYRIHKFSINLDETDIAYVKCTFDQNSANEIFMGEFEVRGSTLGKTITNLASGRMSNTANYTYEITGNGNTTHPTYTDYTVSEYERMNLSRLTDGAYGTYVSMYRNDDRIITLDLGAVRNVTSFWMDFASFESSGVYLPSKVKYFASENGTDYYLVKEIKKSEAVYNTTSGNYSLYWFRTNTVCVNARYVKIVFPTSVTIAPDELVINGYSTASTQAIDLTTKEKYDPLANYVGEMADTTITGGVKNEYLAYCGWSGTDPSSNLQTQKLKSEMLAAISYVNMSDVAQDWLFDGVTMIPHHHTSGGKWNLYQASATTGSSYANKDDWDEWLCYAFGEDTSGNTLYSSNQVINLKALENAAATAKAQLNDPDYKVKVKMSIFPAVHFQDNWGTLNGEKIDFTVKGTGSIAAAIENRKKAYQWYVDKTLQLWEKANFQHLEFTGFYYFEEAIREGADDAARGTIQALSEIMRNTSTPSTNTLPAFDNAQGGKLYFYQIPFYQAEGYYDWKTYGFDYVIMQPNLSFVDAADGIAQLKNCADSATRYGLGFEMEFGGVNDTYINKFQYYLNYGKDYGYVNTILGWYMGTWGVYQLSNGSQVSSSISNTRYIYDDIYEFVLTNREALDLDGDINDDGKLTINDATQIQKYLAKITTFKNKQVTEADANADGKVSIRDVTTIQMKIAKLID